MALTRQFGTKSALEPYALPREGISVTEADRDVEMVMLAEARSEVATADHKASMVLVALGVGFGAVLGGLLAGDWEPSDLDGAGEFLWWIGAVIALTSVVCAAAAVWPRYSKDDVSGGIFYWGHVATFSSLTGLTAALDHESPPTMDRTRHQLFALSKIVNKKYNLVRTAMCLAAGACLFFLLSSLVGG